MAVQQYFQTGGINTYINPLLNDGALIHSVNMLSFPYGAKTKRTGYSTFLGTPDTSQINSLFDFPRNNGTETYLYRASGSSLYQSYQGTGVWTLTANGTISDGSHVGHAILDDTMIIGDGVGSTRHTTTGTSFTDTTLAPIAPDFEQYQGRIYAIGTSSTAFYSTTNDATNWNTSGTSDSSSFTIPGDGKLSSVFKVSDQLNFSKNTRSMFKWDGYALVDMSTNYGPSSPYSISKSEDYSFFINQFGQYGYGGARPQLLSNAVQRLFYNAEDTGVTTSLFPTIAGQCHKYDYFAALGTVTDDFTSRQISNCLLKYDYQKNEHLTFSLSNNPTALLSYKDVNNAQQLIFGDSSGQCYKFDTSTTDNGNAISAEMVFVFTHKVPEYEKKWNWWRGVFNPGCEAKVQIACANTFTYESLVWKELGDCKDGVCEYRFPANSRSNLLFVRIYESSVNAPFTYYGCSISAEPIIKQ